MSDVSEEWRPVVGYEGFYEVSSLGRVRSLDRYFGRRLYQGRVLKAITITGGYQSVNLCVNGEIRKGGVHLLVMAAFVGPKPHGMHTCHNNGDPGDNRLENLRYDTPSANGLDSVKHGTCAQAAKGHCPNGHRYDDANTRWVKTPFGGGVGRQCRTCDRARQQEKRERNRADYNAAARRRRREKKSAAQTSASVSSHTSAG